MKSIDKKLDTLWSEIVKKRALNICEVCEKSSYLNAHHIIGRRNKSVRWNISNGVCLCPNCHVFSATMSAHQTPTIFSEWIISKRGNEWHEGLVLLANEPKKWLNFEKEALLNEFKEMLNK